MSRSPRPATDYHARLQRVSDYIHDHLDQPLNMLQLAELACLSPEHWHRIYAAFFGETMAATVKRLRLQRAAAFLAQSALPIQQVALQSGYPNVQSFTRTFSNTYGLPPAQYRQGGQHTVFHYTQPQYQDGAFEVRHVDIQAIAVIGVPHRGSFMGISKAFGTLYGWLGAHQVNAAGLRCLGIYHDDPFQVEEAALRSQACVVPEAATLAQVTLAPPLQHSTIAGGHYAVLQYCGPYASMHAAYRWLFGYWLPRSGWDVADSPVFEDYLNNPQDTAPTDLCTDIYMPLRAPV